VSAPEAGSAVMDELPARELRLVVASFIRMSTTATDPRATRRNAYTRSIRPANTLPG
jgi:hypothetical protein